MEANSVKSTKIDAAQVVDENINRKLSLSTRLEEKVTEKGNSCARP